MITKFEVRQEMHNASPLLGESRLIRGPFDTLDEAIDEARALSMPHIYIVEKTYASDRDLDNHYWSALRLINLKDTVYRLNKERTHANDQERQ